MTRSPIPFWSAAALVTFLVGACATPFTGPDIQMPPGAHPLMSLEEVERQVLGEIAENERTLGRSLAPTRFIKLWYAPAGTMQRVLFRDGSPQGAALVLDTDGWIVEVEGTLAASDLIHATRAYYSFDEDGSYGQAIIPCWRPSAQPGDPGLEGWCP